MNINNYLKRIDVTKVDLAKELKLSRPTLNLYIEQFELGKKIENERYDIIFNRLFSNEKMERAEFDKRLESVKFLLDRDKRYDIGRLSPESADMVSRIHNMLIEDLSDNQWNKKVYDAIIILLDNYRENSLLKEIACYYSDLNSDSDLTGLDEKSKAYYSYFNKCIRGVEAKPPKFDLDEYELFLDRKKEIKNKRDERNRNKTKNIQQLMKKIIGEVDKEYKEKGVELSEEEMLGEVIRRIRAYN